MWEALAGRAGGGVCAKPAAAGEAGEEVWMRVGWEGAEGLARTGRRRKAFLSFDQSGTCCVGLGHTPEA